MSVQLALELPDARITDGPHPEGVLEFELEDGARYLVESGCEDGRRVLGWYYGYPTCCVEAFISGRSPEPPQPHPVSGHVLCRTCSTGVPAPLPARPAERYGFIRWYEGDAGHATVYPPTPRPMPQTLVPTDASEQP
jgi:hypothetical protein